MPDLYYQLVLNGKRTIEQVPNQYRDEVQAKLNA